MLSLAPGSTVAGIFTTNRFCAAPVMLAKKHLKDDVQAQVENVRQVHPSSNGAHAEPDYNGEVPVAEKYKHCPGKLT